MAERPPSATWGSDTPHGWLLLVYKVPSEPSRARVAVWRDLKRLGALYLQQAVCILPRLGDVPERLEAVRHKIAELDGSCYWFTLDRVDADLEARLVEGFREQSAREYADIVAGCQLNVVDAIGRIRAEGSLTFERSEEIRAALEKLRRCLGKMESRDRFGATGAGNAHRALEVASMHLAELESDIGARVTGSAAPNH